MADPADAIHRAFAAMLVMTLLRALATSAPVPPWMSAEGRPLEHPPKLSFVAEFSRRSESVRRSSRLVLRLVRPSEPFYAVVAPNAGAGRSTFEKPLKAIARSLVPMRN
jgi:hypothetical protein